MTDPFDLERFVLAQDDGDVYTQALAELTKGRKTTHWMWFVFPQLEGLGQSPMAVRYAIRSLDEAREYAAHAVLGARLRECVAVLNGLPEGTSPQQIFGPLDAMKLRSSLTLFARAVPEERSFGEALARYFERPDPETVALLV